MLLERQRVHLIQVPAHLQTPAQTQRQEAEPARKAIPLLQTATLQSEATAFERLEQRLDLPTMTILCQQITRLIADDDQVLIVSEAPASDIDRVPAKRVMPHSSIG